MKETGELVNLTEILLTLEKFRPIDGYAYNNFDYYYGAIFPSTQIINNIPVLYFNTLEDYILFEFTIPDNGFVDNVNFVNITPYFYSYLGVDVFASTDKSLEYFEPKLNPGDTIKVVFTSSQTIGDYFTEQGYRVSRFPFDYIGFATVTFLLRIGNLTGTYNPGSLEQYSKLEYNKFTSPNKLVPYTSFEILSTQPIVYGSKYLYENGAQYLNSLLDLYNKQQQILLDEGYTQLPTYLYQQNIPTPQVNYAFQSFYDCITVNPYIQLQGNNTGESYFNTNLLNLNDYPDTIFAVVSVNQNKYGYAIYSNIQVYDKTNLVVLTNLSYSTSPPIPVISYPTYPYIDENSSENLKYPLIKVNKFTTNELINKGSEEIFISERAGYNPINFNHPDNYTTPRFTVFIKKIVKQ
jgi:hypothetical protein